VQLLGTRFHITLGGLQLRVGISLEDQSEAQPSEAPDSRYRVEPFASRYNVERQETVR
jgi:hypothetical protein